MTVRINRVTTRSGDDGRTGLADGSRLPKHAPRMEAIGTVDELNALLGLFRAALPRGEIDDLIGDVQQRLFDLGGGLSLPGTDRFPQAAVAALEHALAHYNAGLPPLTSFILPAGSEVVARCHLARTVCRRAERCLTALAEAEPGTDAPVLRVYLNRLSDLLFVLARWLAREDGSEVLWTPRPEAE